MAASSRQSRSATRKSFGAGTSLRTSRCRRVMSSSYRKQRALVSNGALAAAALCLAAVRAGAASWDLNPRLEVGGTVNDNLRLAETAADRVRVAGAAVDAQLAMRSLTPRSALTILPRVHSTYF